MQCNAQLACGVQVCSESTGHAEAVQMTYDPQQVGYDKLVDLFYSRHNSTTPNRAGNDVGTQYRSGIYYHTEEQKQVQPIFPPFSVLQWFVCQIFQGFLALSTAVTFASFVLEEATLLKLSLCCIFSLHCLSKLLWAVLHLLTSRCYQLVKCIRNMSHKSIVSLLWAKD